MDYDIFISYRRIGGAQYARILQLMLQQHGYKVFLDYDELTDGVFGDHIKAAIKSAPIFILILSEKSMWRCKYENDWVRQEILLAIQENKHIIPINPDNTFDGWPQNDDINSIPSEIKTKINAIQFSEIGFGQTLGVTIDMLIKNRLAPTLKSRKSNDIVDDRYDTAQVPLKKKDINKRIIRLSCILLFLVGFIFIFLLIVNIEHIKCNKLQDVLHEKYRSLGLYLSPDLTREQLNTIDKILLHMREVQPDTLWMGQFEFTVGEWYGILNEKYDISKKNYPMVNISFGDIYSFICTLSDMTNIDFGLPSVDEWKYAAQGGKFKENYVFSGNNDPDAVAWYKDNSGNVLHPSDGQQGKEPNRLDLYDMSGNVSEWCNTSQNEENPGLYLVCGGNYTSPASEISTLSCQPFPVDSKDVTIGFRIVIHLNGYSGRL